MLLSSSRDDGSQNLCARGSGVPSNEKARQSAGKHQSKSDRFCFCSATFIHEGGTRATVKAGNRTYSALMLRPLTRTYRCGTAPGLFAHLASVAKQLPPT